MILLLISALATPPELKSPPTVIIDETTRPDLFKHPCQMVRFDREEIPALKHCAGYIVPEDVMFSLRQKVEVELPHWKEQAMKQHAYAVSIEEPKARVPRGLLVLGTAIAVGSIAGYVGFEIGKITR